MTMWTALFNPLTSTIALTVCMHFCVGECIKRRSAIPWLMTSQPPQSEQVSDAAAQVQEATDPSDSPFIYMDENSTIMCNPWCNMVIISYICKHHTTTNVWWISPGYFHVYVRGDNAFTTIKAKDMMPSPL